MAAYIENYGFTKTYVNNNNKISNKLLQWEGNYDGQNAFLNLHSEDDGHVKNIAMKLDKKDLLELMAFPSIGMSLDKRLSNDFSTTRTNNKTKRHRKHKKKSTKHRKTKGN